MRATATARGGGKVHPRWATRGESRVASQRRGKQQTVGVTQPGGPRRSGLLVRLGGGDHAHTTQPVEGRRHLVTG